MPAKGRASRPRLRAVSNVVGARHTDDVELPARQGGQQIGDGGAGAEPDGHAGLHQSGGGFSGEALLAADVRHGHSHTSTPGFVRLLAAPHPP